MTCFSNEANSLVKECSHLVHSMPGKSSYDYPPELLALQGQKKIFQLHFDPECTKARQNFILDTCWDDMSLLLPGPAALATPGSEIPEEKQLTKPFETEIVASTPEDKPATDHLPISLTVTPPPQVTPELETKKSASASAQPETSLEDQSKGQNEGSSKNIRRALFQENKGSAAQEVSKRAKKDK